MSYVPKKLKKVGSIQKAPLTKSVVVKTKPKMAWERAYDARFTGSKFGNEAIGLFALGLQFNIDDIDAVGAESVTGHGDDKKCDLCYFDEEEARCVIAQCYVSTKARQSAPSNKAADLNTAVTWLLTTPISKVPAAIKASATELRAAIASDSINELLIWYVHNCPESVNVHKELAAVEHSARVAVKAINAKSSLQIFARELGQEQFSRLYDASRSAILVTDTIETTVPHGYQIEGADWTAFQTYVPGQVIFDLFAKHGADLFSANVRDYLGSRESTANINNGIKATATKNPENFWVYNNGITALVNGLSFKTLKAGSLRLKLDGISIVNGAQTTGAIGSLPERPDESLLVPIRFIWTNSRSRVENIIRFNNSQNKVSASDFRSSDAIQKRLKAEFSKIPSAEYEGGRRGGVSDTIQRRPTLLPSYTVGQALAAFHGNPVIAYDRKSEIWISSSYYSTFFRDETTAAHIVFAYSLHKANSEIKLGLVSKRRKEDVLTETEKEQLEFFEKKGSILLTCAAIAGCLEVVLERPLPNRFGLSFGGKVSPESARDFWLELLPGLLALVSNLNAAFSSGRITTELVKLALPPFRQLVQATAAANKSTFKSFSGRVKKS